MSQRALPAALRALGVRVHTLSEKFPPGTADVDWLPIVGARGWILITKDNVDTYKDEIKAEFK